MLLSINAVVHLCLSFCKQLWSYVFVLNFLSTSHHLQNAYAECLAVPLFGLSSRGGGLGRKHGEFRKEKLRVFAKIGIIYVIFGRFLAKIK